MNFEDEPYARVYTRDTVTWKMLGWEGQTVLLHMLRDKFDRSGVLDLECHDPSQAVTAITGLPISVTEPGLKRLLETKTWVLSNTKLVWPNYVEAQTCKRSDKARQQESRKNRNKDALVHNGHDVSRAVTKPRKIVTKRHDPSHGVTPSRAEPSSTEQSRSPAPLGSGASGDVDPSLTEIPREKPLPTPPTPKPRQHGKPPAPRPDLLFAKIQARDYEPTDEHRSYAAELGIDAEEFENVLIELRDKSSVPRGRLPPTGHDLPWWDKSMCAFIEARVRAKAERAARMAANPKKAANAFTPERQLARIKELEAQETLRVAGISENVG